MNLLKVSFVLEAVALVETSDFNQISIFIKPEP